MSAKQELPLGLVDEECDQLVSFLVRSGTKLSHRSKSDFTQDVIKNSSSQRQSSHYLGAVTVELSTHEQTTPGLDFGFLPAAESEAPSQLPKTPEQQYKRKREDTDDSASAKRSREAMRSDLCTFAQILQDSFGVYLCPHKHKYNTREVANFIFHFSHEYIFEVNTNMEFAKFDLTINAQGLQVHSSLDHGKQDFTATVPTGLSAQVAHVPHRDTTTTMGSDTATQTVTDIRALLQRAGENLEQIREGRKFPRYRNAITSTSIAKFMVNLFGLTTNKYYLFKPIVSRVLVKINSTIRH